MSIFFLKLVMGSSTPFDNQPPVEFFAITQICPAVKLIKNKHPEEIPSKQMIVHTDFLGSTADDLTSQYPSMDGLVPNN